MYLYGKYTRTNIGNHYIHVQNDSEIQPIYKNAKLPLFMSMIYC